MSERDAGGFVIGFLVGALAGATAALLLTPYSGKELRLQIKEKGVELKTEAEQFAESARIKAEEAQERGRIVLSENVRKAQQAVQEAQVRLGKPAGDSAEVPPA